MTKDLLKDTSVNLSMYEMPTTQEALAELRSQYPGLQSGYTEEIWVCTRPHIGSHTTDHPRRVFICLVPGGELADRNCIWLDHVDTIHNLLKDYDPDGYIGFAEIDPRKTLVVSARDEPLRVRYVHYCKTPTLGSVRPEINMFAPPVAQIPTSYAVKFVEDDSIALTVFKTALADTLTDAHYPTVLIGLNVEVIDNKQSYQFAINSGAVVVNITVKDDSEESLLEVINTLKYPLINLVDKIACNSVSVSKYPE